MTACLPLFLLQEIDYHTTTSPITCSCLSYHLQLLLYTGTKLQHKLDLLAGNMRRILPFTTQN